MDDDFDRVFVDLWEALPGEPDSQADSYDDERGVRFWKEMTEDPDYTLYADCTAALDQTLEVATWCEVTGGHPVGTIIDLGVGTGTKTCTMLRRLGPDRLPARAILTDASEPMLRYAYSLLKRKLGPESAAVPVTPVRVDIVRALDKLRGASLLPSHRRAGEIDIFPFLGCTFANTSEHDTMHVLQATLVRGDRLVLGVECFRAPGLPDRHPHELLAPYRSAACRAFWMDYATRRAALDSGRGLTISQDYEASALRSSVPNAASILVSAAMDDGTPEVLMVANRYCYSSLVDYITRVFSFRHVLSVPSPRNPYYFHFVFART